MPVNGLISMVSMGLLKTRNLKGFRGFTLAEVLITLVIIGVIAAMTIPTLMNNTNKQELVSRLKKAYSTLAQATNKVIAEEGSPRGDIGGWATSAEAVYNIYKKYLPNIKDCGLGSGGCFTGTYKRLNNTSASYDSTSSKYAFILADGTEVMISTGSIYLDCNNAEKSCASFLVDVNGAKGPNYIGYDAFGFDITENGLAPSGCNTDGCRKGVDIGWSCACKVLREGAINY